MKHTSKDIQGLWISKVIITDVEAFVYMHYRNYGSDTARICVHAPGAKGNLVLKPKYRNESRAIVRSYGIDICPSRTAVAPSQEAEFVVVFPDMDEAWSPFDIFENRVANPWTFKEVELD